MNKLRINDEVIIIAGKDKGKTGKVLNINDKTKKVLVEGINIVKKSLRQSEQQTESFLDIEKPISISNLLLKSPKTGAPTRVGIILKEGKKVRIAKKCGTILE